MRPFLQLKTESFYDKVLQREFKENENSNIYYLL